MRGGDFSLGSSTTHSVFSGDPRESSLCYLVLKETKEAPGIDL